MHPALGPAGEAFLWPGALILLYFLPGGSEQSWCLYHALGIEWCPGCGLGRGIHELLHGNFQASWELHKGAAPAAVILLFRSLQVSIKHYFPLWKDENYSA